MSECMAKALCSTAGPAAAAVRPRGLKVELSGSVQSELKALMSAIETPNSDPRRLLAKDSPAGTAAAERGKGSSAAQPYAAYIPVHVL